MDTEPLIPPPSAARPPPLSLLTRLNYATQLWTFKILVTTALGLFRLVQQGKVNSVKPTYTKSYRARPMLKNRVFFPRGWKSGVKLPLYIDIHGGGFALCDPQTGADYASSFEVHVLIVNNR
jgi:acetyl esterase/lipase